MANEFDFTEYYRRMLIITVGSSATIHLLGKVAKVYPDVLFMNKIMVIETSKKVYRDAINYLAKIYHENYARLRGREPDEQRRGFPTSKFKHELEENSILLGTEGGGATPERGLDLFDQRRSDVINRIVSIVRGMGSERELSGIIVIGASGKGTGTLVTPALVKEIMDTPGLPMPLGFLTLPFRFEEEAVKNAMKITEWLKKVPMFLLDYERAVGNYLYLYGGVSEKEIPTVELYKMVVRAMTEVLKNLIEALNFSVECNPPLDWSDLSPILTVGKVGTVAYSSRPTKDALVKYWKDDLGTMLLLRTKTKPSQTKAKVIVRGNDIPLQVDREIAKFHRKYFNAMAGRHLLARGDGFSIISLIHGFDPDDITPPLEVGRSLVERLLGL